MKNFELLEIATPTGESWVTCVGNDATELEADRVKHLRQSLDWAKAEGAKLSVQVDDRIELTEESVKLAWAPVRDAKTAAESAPKESGSSK